MSRHRFTRLDALLVLVIIAWGANLSVIKVALREFPGQSLNALRMILAAAAFLVVLARTSPATTRGIARADWRRVAFLGVVGGTLYQLLFLAGVPRTSVANAGLIFGLSPVVISLMSAAVGHERLPWTRWAGGALSVVGLYFVVGHGVDFSGQTLRGDLLMLGGVLCWATYSVASQPILKRHSPLIVIALTFSVGAMLYVVVMTPILANVDWRSISAFSWFLMLSSAVLALNVSYWIWYTGLKRLGGSRTSVYSYLTPIVAIIVAAIWLGEPISFNQVAGAAAIFAGLIITRFT